MKSHNTRWLAGDQGNITGGDMNCVMHRNNRSDYSEAFKVVYKIDLFPKNGPEADFSNQRGDAYTTLCAHKQTVQTLLLPNSKSLR